MPIYTFYPRRADGGSSAFDAMELRDDDQARAFADRVLAAHASAVEVAIWAGEREVGHVSRLAAAE
jgi:type IV pilus biogenesis protein CpaD/CtpE